MSTREAGTGTDPVIESRADLISVFSGGEKPKARWRIGTEHEKFVFFEDDRRAPSYEERGGIHALLIALTRFGWEPIYEGENVIALKGADGNVSLEPAGQFELSGAPLDNLHETCAETARHLSQVKDVGEKLGIGFLGVGLWPDKTREELPIMPKGRYDIMLRHMPRVGSMGLDMMLRTCTIQTNLDYSSEADMVKKFRVSLALQPLATALFANSPFLEGKPNGFLSYRSHIWTDTDPHRTGMLPFVYEDGFGYERYADYMLDVPMYFAFRDGYVDASGLDFKDFLKGELSALPGEKPTIADWNDHLSTAFPEVRLKSFLEMRGADGGPHDRICALPAFWVGLLYDDVALDAAWDEIKHWTIEDHHRIRAEVPKLGLKAKGPRGRDFQALGKIILDIADAGLKARARLNAGGEDERVFLDPLRVILESGKTPAERLLELYHGPWGGDISGVYRDARF
ncbi:glutamate--cysteine ligase [Sphingomonas montanisoli]|uniref:Glutamate--cysteine ligase n=1 Tax=Sphingomonas montanisoli TaxID=2606412 RepID=A0A5D9C8H5_9SPHN|nr:glutamate--cysteine ligase [Sphingomonas montanisoli]TZG28029.1 glutamate--cysteine ligase [Sphingomonas montanisoli]